MYDLDKKRIEKQLLKLEQCISVMETVKGENAEFIFQNDIQRFATERALHIAVECITDIGNAFIDGFIMRDPGSYSDIIDILEDEKVFPSSLAKNIQQIISLRKKLVHYYEDVETEELVVVAKNGLENLPLIRKHIQAYLEKELAGWNN